MKRVLVLENDPAIRSFISINLDRKGYSAVEADSASDVQSLIASQKNISLAILDEEGADVSVLELCRNIRSSGSGLGIILLSEKSNDIDKVAGLMAGADDYITTPFSPSELFARVDALSRRLDFHCCEENGFEIASGPFTLNLKNRTIEKYSLPINLTQTEYNIIRLLMENTGKSLSRSDILNSIWGGTLGIDPKIVDVNIRRIRSKIEVEPSNPEYLKTSWGYGYKWEI